MWLRQICAFEVNSSGMYTLKIPLSKYVHVVFESFKVLLYEMSEVYRRSENISNIKFIFFSSFFACSKTLTLLKCLKQEHDDIYEKNKFKYFKFTV